MLYVQLNEKIKITAGKKVLLQDVAQAVGDNGEKAQKTVLYEKLNPGIWMISASSIAEKLMAVDRDIRFTGAEECTVHVSGPENKNGFYMLRCCAAFLLLFFGSALAITWFHEDVGMQEAQNIIFEKLSGRQPESVWDVTLPYAVGVGIGVAFYYGLFSFKKMPSPLDIKMKEYCEKTDAEMGKKL